LRFFGKQMHVRCNEIAVDRAAADRSARVLPRMWVRPLPPRDASRLSGLAEAPALLIPCPCRVSGRLRSGSGHVSRFVRSLIQPSRQEGHRAQKLQISLLRLEMCFRIGSIYEPISTKFLNWYKFIGQTGPTSVWRTSHFVILSKSKCDENLFSSVCAWPV
jgi:hypothetical protein